MNAIFSAIQAFLGIIPALLAGILGFFGMIFGG
jgi:hypothetical protein